MRTSTHAPAVLGVLRRRLLVNALVDPGEAAAHLPPALRPHVTAAGTVVGCCLLDIEHLRPTHLPAPLGIAQRAAAHRISAEWDEKHGEPVVGVYVPERRTSSRLAIVLGGRWFPGVHRLAELELAEVPDGLTWSVHGGPFHIDVTVRTPDGAIADLACDPIAGTCVGADVGLSPNHRGVLEGARMRPSARTAREVTVDTLSSSFLSRFATAVPAPAYLMEDVAVSWSRASAPRTVRVPA